MYPGLYFDIGRKARGYLICVVSILLLELFLLELFLLESVFCIVIYLY